VAGAAEPAEPAVAASCFLQPTAASDEARNKIESVLQMVMAGMHRTICCRDARDFGPKYVTELT
jgi:hypothetical protein